MTNVDVKVVFFSVVDNKLLVYFPDKLPHVKIEQDLSLEKAVSSLFTKTVQKKLSGEFVEQLQTLSRTKNQITIAYYILLPQTDIEEKQKNWRTPESIVKTNPDYDIVSYAVQRLQWKIEYTNVVYSLLPQEFTLRELQNAYEAILGKVLDKRNFRKKMLSLKFLKATDKKRMQTARPAQMYAFTERIPTIVKIFS